MSLDKAIAHGKEFRKPYMGAKRCDKSCRNHGGCPYCERNRLHKFRDKHPSDWSESMPETVWTYFLSQKKEDDSVGPLILSDFTQTTN